MNQYQQRVNAERLACQAPAVQKTAKEILYELKSIELYLYWSLDPEDNKDQIAYNVGNLIDHAHALVDLGHAWHARVLKKPNPPPKDQEDDNDAAAYYAVVQLQEGKRPAARCWSKPTRHERS